MNSATETAPWDTPDPTDVAPWDTPDPSTHEPILKSLFPNNTAANAAGASGRNPLPILKDLASLPSRALAAAVTDQKMSDPEAYLLKPVAEPLIAGAERDTTEASHENYADPYLGFSRPAGVFNRPVAEFIAKTASDPLTYLTAPEKAAAAASDVASGINKFSGRLAQELSGVPQEALRVAGTPAGRDALKAASGREAEIGQKLADAVKDFHNYLPEKAQVEAALKQMPPVNISGTIKALQSAKVPARSGIILPHEVKANQEIDNVIAGLRGNSGTKFPKTQIPAEDAYSIRKGLDYNIDFDTPEGKIVNNALKGARTQLKNDLLSSAGRSGNPDYANAMQTWSQKLKLLDKLDERLGVSQTTKEARAESFVKNLFGENSKNKQDIVADLDKVFGSNFLDEAKMTKMARDLGEGGKPAILPRQTTGRATLSAAGGGIAGAIFGNPVAGGAVAAGLAAHASPYLASQMILPGTQAAADLLKAAATQGPRAQALSKAFEKATGAALQARILNQIQNEIKKNHQEDSQ